MDVSPTGLARYIREHRDAIIDTWETSARRLPGNRELERPVLRNDMARVVEHLADRIRTPFERLDYVGTPRIAVREHVLQRAEAGITQSTVAAELMALRDAVETCWPGTKHAEAHAALHALRTAVDGIVIASIERFAYVRTRLLDTLETIVRTYPARSMDQTLRNVLHAVIRGLEGIDTAAVLLREGKRLRVRAAVGLEAEAAAGVTLDFGEGFAGVIAEERKARSLRVAATDPLVASQFIHEAKLRSLYGVPLLRGDELLGVAHIGSRSASDFSEATKTIFRITMDRIAGVLYQQLLQEQLSAEQARYRAVVENSPAVIFSKDADGRYVTINQRALARLGMTPEQFVGHKDSDVFPPEVAREMRGTDLTVLATGRTVEHEEVVPGAGSEPRTYLTVKFPIRDLRGVTIGTGGVSTDITDRRRWERGQDLLLELEDQFSASLELDFHEWMPDVARRIVPLLADCCILDIVEEDGSINRVAAEHHDPRKRDLAEQVRTFPVDRARPHLVETVLRSREPLMIARLTSAYVEAIAQSPAHLALLHEIDPRSMIQIPLTARDRLLGALVLLRCGPASSPYDSSDLRLAIELGRRTSFSLDNSRLFHAARGAARAREEILAVVAHDLRNPLGAILLSAHNLRDEPHDEAFLRRSISRIIRASERMMKLVQDLLDQRSVERGDLFVAPGERATVELLRDVIEAQRSRVESAGLRLDLEADDYLPPIVVDLDRFHQLIGNLIENAVKFTPKGGRVQLGASLGDHEVRFYVRDSGPGFPPESLPHVFDRYWKGGGEGRRGSGLGLSICKGIVEAHGGHIWAANEPDGGATVHFTLPEARLLRSPYDPRFLH